MTRKREFHAFMTFYIFIDFGHFELVENEIMTFEREVTTIKPRCVLAISSG